MKNKQPIVIITMNPKDSNIYRKLASRLTYDSYGVERGYERFFFYKYAIPSGLIGLYSVIQLFNYS